MEPEEAVDFDPEAQSEAPLSPESPPELPRKRGRPRLNPVPEPTVTPPEMGEPFPLPPRPSVKGGNIGDEDFFSYWKALEPKFQERCSVYIYRQWPALDHMLILTEEERMQIRRRERKKPATYITKYLQAFDSTDWKSEILRRHGSGDYKLYLNDGGERGANRKTLPPRTVCKTAISLRDEDYPPVIEDTRIIDRFDPVNASFLEKLRLTGKLDDRSPEEEHEMQVTTNAQNAQASAVETLANTVKDLAKDAREGSKGPVVNDPGATAATESVKVMANAAMEGQKIVSNALDTAQKMQVAQSDPLSKIGPVIELVKTLIPAPAAPSTNAADMITLFGKMLEVQKSASDTVITEMRARLESTERMHKEALDRLAGQANPTPAATGETSELKVLNNMLNIKAKLDELAGGTNESGIPGWIPYALQGAKILGDVVTNVFHNAAVAKTGHGQPLPPPETTAELPEGEEGADGPAQYPIYARQIHAPMRDALLSKTPGYEFGAKICFAMKDTTAYDFLVSQGKEGLMQLLQSAPEVWGTFLQFGEGRQNEIFLEEFMNRQAVMEKIEELRNPQPQTRTRPIVMGDGSTKRGAGPVVNATAEPA